MCSVDDPQQVLLPGRPDQPVSGCSVGACGVRYVRSVAAAYEPEGEARRDADARGARDTTSVHGRLLIIREGYPTGH